MKLLELEVRDLRGIRELKLEPNGSSFVIWGPNGSGKSAVVDSLDFLLTGKISRLEGEGTSGITLSKYGPHIDRKRTDAVVTAKIQIRNWPSPITITRCVACPNELDCKPKEAQEQLSKVIEIAQRGQHVLTRREILKFVTAEAGKRAERIQLVLNLTDVDSIRKSLMRVKNHFDSEKQISNAALKKEQETIKVTLGEKSYLPAKILERINDIRAKLGGASLDLYSVGNLKEGIVYAAAAKTDALKAADSGLVVPVIKSIIELLSADKLAEIAIYEEELRTLINSVREHDKPIGKLNLVKQGIELLGQTGKCPLCGVQWVEGELERHLKEELQALQDLSEKVNKITLIAGAIKQTVTFSISSVENIVALTNRHKDMQAKAECLSAWVEDLRQYQEMLSNSIEKYNSVFASKQKVSCLFASPKVISALKNIATFFTDTEASQTPEQLAWDTLTRLEENIKALESAEQSAVLTSKKADEATKLYDAFLGARDLCLEKLYESIRDRFIELYKQIHNEDESEFTAILEPIGAGVNLLVDFYGKDAHPPQALHSEGHQDSMGVCLYLALSEKLTEGIFDLAVLDDVVMSVDAEHRKGLCKMLKNSFPDRQFFITTHDKNWSYQLKTEAIVTSRNMVEFHNWHVSTGPKVNSEPDMWEKIDELITKGDIHSASSKLRKGSEHFFSLVCDALKVPVIYKIAAKWELGELLPPAESSLKDYLKMAKASAQSWGDHELFDKLCEIQSTLNQVYARTNAERWAVNASVHYNNWENLGPNDFRPVAQAFQDLHGLFVCNNCGVPFFVMEQNHKPIRLTCTCNKINWNLVSRH